MFETRLEIENIIIKQLLFSCDMIPNSTLIFYEFYNTLNGYKITVLLFLPETIIYSDENEFIQRYGIRAAVNKGFIEWLKAADPDVMFTRD